MLSLINAPPLINPLPPKRDAEQIVQHLPLSLTVPLDGSLHLDPSALMTNNRKTCAINYRVVANKCSPSHKPPPPIRDGEQIVQHLPLSLLVQLDESLHLDPSVLMTNNRKTCAINYCVVCNNAPPLINAPIRDGEQIVWLLPQSLVVHLIGSPHLDPSALMTNNRKTCAINYHVVSHKCSHFNKCPP